VNFEEQPTKTNINQVNVQTIIQVTKNTPSHARMYLNKQDLVELTRKKKPKQSDIMIGRLQPTGRTNLTMGKNS
jgi:hypothetical protein